MTKRRNYRLLCPIARALDVLGDRWTLLILVATCTPDRPASNELPPAGD